MSAKGLLSKLILKVVLNVTYIMRKAWK